MVRIEKTEQGFALYKEKECIGSCRAQIASGGGQITDFIICPQWRRRGYGSYFLKEILRAGGGYDTQQPSIFTVPLPSQPGELEFWARFGFCAEEDKLVRRKMPDMSAVRFVQEYLAAHLTAPSLCIDATCGNGNDTAFLCRLVGDNGRVVGFDIQGEAIAKTRQRLIAEGIPPQRYTLVQDSHANLLQYVAPGQADAAVFNFGWLPGADHAVYSTAESSIPALESALTALRPGGILAAVLYSGAVIGGAEKSAILTWLEALPLERYTVLVCRFANWADTAPLPCLVLKKAVQPPAGK